MERTIFRVTYNITVGGGAWVIAVDGKIIAAHRNQNTAQGQASYMARRLWDDWKLPAQAVFHERDGSFGEERTYPDTTPNDRG
jgi:hypothetical protein